MEIILLGSGTCIPSLKRGSAGTVVKTGDINILVDSGIGTLHSLLKVGLTCNDIDIICYTHIHPDHISELVPFIFACKYGESPRRKELVILGGNGFSDFFENLQGAFKGWLAPEEFNLTVRELVNSQFIFNDIIIKGKPLRHIKESIGFRIEYRDNRSVVFSGDTDYCSEMIELAHKTDLLVLECSHPDGFKVSGHLSPSLAGKIALKSACRQLLLTHFYPVCKGEDIFTECRKIYKGHLILGNDLVSIFI